jgi:starvation-inducible outer membrane lipoprotein
MTRTFAAVALAVLVAGCASTNPGAAGADEAAVDAVSSRETMTGSNIPKKDRAGSRVITVDPAALESLRGGKAPSGSGG